MSKFEIEEKVGKNSIIYRGDCYADLLLLYQGVNQLDKTNSESKIITTRPKAMLPTLKVGDKVRVVDSSCYHYRWVGTVTSLNIVSPSSIEVEFITGAIRDYSRDELALLP